MNAAAIARHVPVLLTETLAGLGLAPNGLIVDGTVGHGGHAAAILAHTGPAGQLLGIDRDPAALAVAAEELAPYGSRAVLVHGSYADLADHVRAAGWARANGVLLDLGFSTAQIDDPDRGFSFQSEGPLDMRFDPTAALCAADVVNGFGETELADLLYRYGDERRSRRIARAIVEARPLSSTIELANVVARAVGRRGRIHPATRAFQAIRIAVNEELVALARGLQQAIEVLAPGGRLAVISFASQEDRIVKTTLRDASRDCICPDGLPECRCAHVASMRLVTRRPITPSTSETRRNPRARSARLRVAERLGAGPREATS